MKPQFFAAWPPFQTSEPQADVSFAAANEQTALTFSSDRLMLWRRAGRWMPRGVGHVNFGATQRLDGWGYRILSSSLEVS